MVRAPAARTSRGEQRGGPSKDSATPHSFSAVLCPGHAEHFMNSTGALIKHILWTDCFQFASELEIYCVFKGLRQESAGTQNRRRC